jgi:hypothetical protein
MIAESRYSTLMAQSCESGSRLTLSGFVGWQYTHSDTAMLDHLSSAEHAIVRYLSTHPAIGRGKKKEQAFPMARS